MGKSPAISAETWVDPALRAGVVGQFSMIVMRFPWVSPDGVAVVFSRD
jgi:hypothetical protein